MHFMQPQLFQKMRADLASMWSPSSRTGNSKRICIPSLVPSNKPVCETDGSVASDEDYPSMKVTILAKNLLCPVYFLVLVI